jgi:hypothetical protein
LDLNKPKAKQCAEGYGKEKQDGRRLKNHVFSPPSLSPPYTLQSRFGKFMFIVS